MACQPEEMFSSPPSSPREPRSDASITGNEPGSLMILACESPYRDAFELCPLAIPRQTIALRVGFPLDIFHRLANVEEFLLKPRYAHTDNITF